MLNLRRDGIRRVGTQKRVNQAGIRERSTAASDSGVTA